MYTSNLQDLFRYRKVSLEFAGWSKIWQSLEPLELLKAKLPNPDFDWNGDYNLGHECLKFKYFEKGTKKLKISWA